jgi:hypothetical protein
MSKTFLRSAASSSAAALVAAVRLQENIGAIVSRGGRPDMAGAVLGQAQLQCEKSLEIVPGATHLFDEPGALDQVIDLARQWFTRHLTGRSGEG